MGNKRVMVEGKAQGDREEGVGYYLDCSLTCLVVGEGELDN